MDKKQETIDTYNKSAQGLADKFNAQGPRIPDIEEMFELIKKENPKVLEIGCGNGRDAKEILERTNDYLGIDVSEKLIDIARKEIPEGNFQIADIENFLFPEKIDIVFAFASLIHVTKENLSAILQRAYVALNNGGVMRISLKYSDHYENTTKEDEFGVRTYYLYSPDDIKGLSQFFTIIKLKIVDIRGQEWLEVLLKKEGT